MAKWLTISDVQNLLHVPESTIQRWVRQGNLPCTERSGKYYFNRETLLSWAEAKEIHVEKKDLSRKKPSRIEKHNWHELKEAMERGGLHRLKVNYEWDELYRYVSKLIPYGETIQNQVFEQLVQREELSSTALGHGLAVPHPRIPMKLELQDSLVLSVFLEDPIDLKAPDQKPVFFLFLLLSRKAREHLQFLSQIAKVLNVPSMPSFLSQSPSQEQLLEQFHQILAQ